MTVKIVYLSNKIYTIHIVMVGGSFVMIIVCNHRICTRCS